MATSGAGGVGSGRESRGLGEGKDLNPVPPTSPTPTQKQFIKIGTESRRERSHQNQKLNSGNIFFSSLKGKKLQTAQVLSSPRLPPPPEARQEGTGEQGEAGSLKSHPWAGRLFLHLAGRLLSFLASLCVSRLPPRRRGGKGPGYAGKLSFFPFRTLVM